MNAESYKLLGALADAAGDRPMLSDRMTGEVAACIAVNEQLEREICQQLEKCGGEGCTPLETGTDAELLTRRCYDSIVKMSRALARYPNADEQTKVTARKLIAAREQLVYHLRPYL